MATRFYIGGTPESAPIAPTVASNWEVTNVFFQVRARTVGPFDKAMITIDYVDASAANQDICLVQAVSMPLTPGQTITGGQVIKGQIRGFQSLATNNLFEARSVRVINGATEKKSLFAGRDDNEMSAIALTNRRSFPNSTAGDYTTVAGDYLVFEWGFGGDPAGGSTHTGSIRLGDIVTTDLPENDTETDDLRPWIQLTDTLTFLEESGIVPLMVVSD
jgi:hypothetical protein